VIMSEEEIREIQSYDPWYTIHYKNLQEETPINGHMTWMPSVRAVPADIIKRGFFNGRVSFLRRFFSINYMVDTRVMMCKRARPPPRRG
jgi:hypothetical protein